MDTVIDIPDSTDWLKTPLQDFAQLENALHCQICKEFYDTPMITSCAHSFCSKCIRTSLSADGKCPACRAADQASKLRNNWALQEVVNAFQQARPAGIAFARKVANAELEESKTPAKRKRNDDTADTEADGGPIRRKSRRIAQSSQNSHSQSIEVLDLDGDDDDYAPKKPDDGLVECPLGCGKRMKIEQVEPHLDRCEDEKREAARAKSRALPSRQNDSRAPPQSNRATKPLERLSELNYSMMKEAALAKKLRDIGIPATGAKPLMVRRHTEWVNLWNANCDSSQPRSKQELLRELDIWERTQGGKAPQQNNLSSTIMRKDFDGNAWANRNRDDFARLIADARKKRAAPVSDSTPNDEAPASTKVIDPAIDSVSEQAAKAAPDGTDERDGSRDSGNGASCTDAPSESDAAPNEVPKTSPLASNSDDIREGVIDAKMGPNTLQDMVVPEGQVSEVSADGNRKPPMFAMPQDISDSVEHSEGIMNSVIT